MNLVVFLGTVVLLSCIVITSDSAKKPKKDPRQHTEVVELMADTGYKICMGLGKLIKGRKNFRAQRRCDLFQEAIEDLVSMTDAMVGELDMTQQDMVNNVFKGAHYVMLQMNLKNVAKKILQKKAPSEKEVGAELSKVMGQWILNVATGQDSSGGLGQMPREQIRALRAQGIKLPSYGVLDDDETDEESFLLQDEEEWAEAAGKEYDDEVDPDDTEL